MKREDVAPAIARLPGPGLRRLAERRVYFGHQSVGYDIVEGLAAIGKERPEAGLRIVEARSPAALTAPGVAHAANGRNEDPASKIEDFAATLRGGLGGIVDVAFFKFCYVDFNAGTDVEKVFSQYRAALEELRRAYPAVRFVHVTAPLTVVQSGPKALVRRLLGRPLGGAAANVARARFNGLLRRAYAGKEPLFDLAAVESTRPDGSRVTFSEGGGTFPALAPEYASDGRHLNEQGARWVAAHLLETLVAAGD